tara:strand:- start:436 stop:570 length:135 start_codon:yes stop_codon:yes gene_type:complete
MKPEKRVPNNTFPAAIFHPVLGVIVNQNVGGKALLRFSVRGRCD